MIAILVSFFVAAFVAFLIHFSRGLHLHRTAKGHAGAAVQSSHSLPTPRIGGLAVAFGILAAYFILPNPAGQILAGLFLTALPVFIGGLGEDTGFDISPRMRLVLSFISAAIAIVVFQVWLPPSGIYLLDLVIGYAPILMILTILVSGGISHALNLIDGLNGLAIGTSCIILGGLTILSASVNDTQMTVIGFVIIAAFLGLFILNYPLGKIFLGDAGAYSFGHILTWYAILLLNRHGELAPFAIMLIFFWPIADMLFSMIRRARAGKPIDQPDRLHYHQLVMRGLEIIFIGRAKRRYANPLATAMILPLAAMPVILGVILRENNAYAGYALIVTSLLFVASYRFGVFVIKYMRTRINVS